MKSLLLAPIATVSSFLLPGVAQAQFALGPKVGLNVSRVYLPSSATPKSTLRYQPGLAVGLLATFKFDAHFALQPELLYSQKGYRTYEEFGGAVAGLGYYTTYDVRLDYLTIPVNLVYAQRATGQGYQLFAGPYFGLLCGGRWDRHNAYGASLTAADKHGSVAGDGETANYNASETIYSKRIDLGLQAGLGYRYKDLLIQLTYSLGLSNLAPAILPYGPRPLDGYNGYTNDNYSNYAFQASVAYLLWKSDKAQ